MDGVSRPAASLLPCLLHEGKKGLACFRRDETTQTTQTTRKHGLQVEDRSKGGHV